MNLVKLFLISSLLIFFYFGKSFAEQIVYINMEKIMKESKAGKQITNKMYVYINMYIKKKEFINSYKFTPRESQFLVKEFL